MTENQNELPKQKRKLAPVLLFVYNRPDHAQQVLDALRACPEAAENDLFIYSDRAKNEAAVQGVQQVRELIHSIKGFKNVTIVEQEKNLGIEKSEIEGITKIINQHDKVIVLEDDIVVGPYFLHFMNEALQKYALNKNVYSVTGYSFLSEAEASGLPKYGFLPLASVWGWGTWKDRWMQFRSKFTAEDIQKLCNKKFRKNFDQGYCYSDMLFKQYETKHITWDIAWYWTMNEHHGLTLAPTCTMVNNIGMDGSGVHYSGKDVKNRIEAVETRKFDDVFPSTVTISEEYSAAVRKKLTRMCIESHNALYKMLWPIKEEVKWQLRKALLKWKL